MWLGVVALGIWPGFLTVVGIQDLSNTGMGGFVLVYVPWVLIVLAILWTPAAIVAIKSGKKRAAVVFTAGACLSQTMSFGLMWLFDVKVPNGSLPLAVCAAVFFGTPLVTLAVVQYLSKHSA